MIHAVVGKVGKTERRDLENLLGETITVKVSSTCDYHNAITATKKLQSNLPNAIIMTLSDFSDMCNDQIFNVNKHWVSFIDVNYIKD